MLTGSCRKHHPQAEASQKVTEKLHGPPEDKDHITLNRDGFSEYKNFEREPVPGFCAHISAERIITYQDTNENPGFLVTKWDFRLQNGNPVYKNRFSFTKREFWATNGTLGLLFTVYLK